eukprot:3346831-Prymnesium_polylepis.1
MDGCAGTWSLGCAHPLLVGHGSSMRPKSANVRFRRMLSDGLTSASSQLSSCSECASERGLRRSEVGIWAAHGHASWTWSHVRNGVGGQIAKRLDGL